MLTEYERQYLGRHLDGWTTTGDPYFRGPSVRAEVLPRFRVRSTTGNWRCEGRAVAIGEVVELAADDASTIVGLGRGEYVDVERVKQHYATRRGGSGR
jgi:hypothetical protein